MGQEKKATAESAFSVVTPRSAADIKFFRVRDIEKYQHYRDRNPPWVKLHRELLYDYDFQQLPDATRFHALAIMQMASEYDNKIRNDPQWVAGRIGARDPVDLALLFESGFLAAWRPRAHDPDAEQLPLLDTETTAPDGPPVSTQIQAGPVVSDDASKMLASRYHLPSPETETETEAETHTEADTGRAVGAGRQCVCCGEKVFSKYSKSECYAFAKYQQRQGQLVAGKPIYNPGGLGRTYHRKGEADDEIAEFLRPPPPRREFTDAPCSACFGSKLETKPDRRVTGKKCPACLDERGKPTGKQPKEG